MPVLFKMSDEKQSAGDASTVVVTEATPAANRRSTKKLVVIVVSAILTIAIVLTAILVGMYLFTESQKQLVQYTLSLNKNVQQEVTSDPNDNVVQYHISMQDQDTWVVNDFNKDIQVVKMQTQLKTTCYVSVLNRTAAVDPSKITGPETTDVKQASTMTFSPSNTPVSDTSFLSKKARDMCKGVSVYWLYPQCNNNKGNTNFTAPREKRATYNYAPYFVAWTTRYANADIWCFQGCCKTVCACSIQYYYLYSAGTMYCQWIVNNCPAFGVTANPVGQSCSIGPAGLLCPNLYPAYLPTC